MWVVALGAVLRNLRSSNIHDLEIPISNLKLKALKQESLSLAIFHASMISDRES
jgi:hypothetical protein